MIFLFSLGSNIRCDCSEQFFGDYCQYKRLTTTVDNDKIHVEYKQFDAETLAVIANLGVTNKLNENIPRVNSFGDSFTIASTNRSQFVFCLTNPCENGGTCFVTNTATTKVL
jgi:hypothetical protein